MAKPSLALTGPPDPPACGGPCENYPPDPTCVQARAPRGPWEPSDELMMLRADVGEDRVMSSRQRVNLSNKQINNLFLLIQLTCVILT